MATSADHGARDHATWSASATARNWHCPGALALSAGIPQGPESIHAARGTAAHQISEKSLRSGHAPTAYLGTIEKTKEYQVVIDDELVASATAYVEYVWERHQAGVAAAFDKGLVAPIEQVTLQIEQRFSLAKLDPPFEAGGTADAVLYFAADRLLEVVDLKNGMGIVDATENPQLRTYALGALLANPGLDVARVRVTIVQPRAPLRGETIRSDEFSAADLIEWTWDLITAMHRAKTAEMELALADGRVSDVWLERFLRPGKCKFCPAEAFCPALRNRGVDAMNKAAAWFEHAVPEPINAQDDEAVELAADLDRFALVEDWIKARRARAHQLAEQGVEIPGHRLVESYGHRKWKENTERDLGMVAIREGIDFTEDFYDRKLKSPAAVEKLLGAKRKHLIADLIEKPVTGKTLVRADKTDRPAVPGRAATYFEPQE